MTYFSLIFIIIYSIIVCGQAPRKVTRQYLKEFFDQSYAYDENIDIFYYDLFFDVDYQNRSFKARATIGVEFKFELKVFYLNCSNKLKIDSIIFESQKANFLSAEDMLYVRLNRKIFSGDKVLVDIYYSKNKNSGQQGFYFYESGSVKSFYTFSQPYDAIYWFPCKNDPKDKADSSKVAIKADKEFISVSNGLLIQIDSLPENKKIYRWKNSYPIAHYLISIASANYKILLDEYADKNGHKLKIENYLFQSSYNDNFTRENLFKTKEALRIFEELYGEYPFKSEKYGHAEAFFRGAMEHQTISTMGSFDEFVIAHELAHQWFGNKITCKDWQNIWVNEGFATYSEILYAEYLYGKETADEITKYYIDYAKLAKGSIYLNDVSDEDYIFDFYRTYAKGAIVLHMLRNEIGDTAFFKAIKLYMSDQTLIYSNAGIEDFRAKCEIASNRSLKYFFDQWIYGENYPIAHAAKIISKKNDVKYTVNFKLTQRKNSNPEYFIFPLQIKLSNENFSEIKKVYISKSEEEFSFEMNFEPTTIIFDPNNKLLADFIFESRSKNFNDNLILEIYPNPAKDNLNFKIVSEIPETQRAEAEIYNLYGGEIANKNIVIYYGDNFYNFDITNLSSGVYFLKIKGLSFDKLEKFCVIR